MGTTLDGHSLETIEEYDEQIWTNTGLILGDVDVDLAQTAVFGASAVTG